MAVTQRPASELLRALENDLYPVLAQEDPHKAVDDILELRRRAWRALPALVEVVKAAETQKCRCGYIECRCGMESLQRALANLQKALGG